MAYYKKISNFGETNIIINYGKVWRNEIQVALGCVDIGGVGSCGGFVCMDDFFR